MAKAASRLSATGRRLSAKLDPELAGFGYFVFGAAAGVFRLCLGAQELVCQFSTLGLELSQLALQARQLVGGIGGHGGFHFLGGRGG